MHPIELFRQVSDSLILKSMFFITHSFEACGGSFTSSAGQIFSPNYPKNYGRNEVCEWRIKTDDSHSLTLNLVDFDLEASENCSSDVLIITDPIKNQELWRGCDNQLPNITSYKTEYNEMLITLKTNNNTEAKGFKANYSMTCGSKIVTNSTGVLRLTSEHLKKENCTWIIKSGDPLKKVTLTITHLFIQSIGGIGESICPVKLRVWIFSS